MLRLERKDFNQEAKCSEAGKDVLVAHSEGTAWAPRSGSAFSVAMLRCTKQCNSCVLPAFQCGCCPGAPPGRIPELSLSPQTYETATIIALKSQVMTLRLQVIYPGSQD
ncbi:uncharacterized protein AAES06_023241 isoform 2-T2 [Glossophaga mutica]